ncbi:sigma 54-dependent Fis family transcriptional regulator [Sandaracinus amylolyticus]|uniref:sigma 54-dependent Fis family transcriptional regulator n=1 Tax=Sandaracinus amylolyticus TaxID=927083 RepID=UPI001F1D3391|nr:sigma 54-dependent Fis family transcriptional regulator [Sandaracinus amylolyticus]UJR83195.1 Hypothetical protein I5071_52610 [Sandaracinus amylolyticus]
MSSSQRTERSARARLAGPGRLRITVMEGPDAGATVEPSTSGGASIGVAPDNVLVLSDRTVSRYHVELRLTRDGIDVEDLGSLNGTWIGDARVQRATVRAGTRIRTGDTVLQLDDATLPLDAMAADESDVVPEIRGLVAVSPAMKALLRLLHQLAPTEVSVLVSGETGCGKEVVARALHDLGKRAAGPFEVVDCGSMPATLIASELFGHERGAFTGADKTRAGAFERAQGGTIFLDEVGELPLELQPVLLGALERRRFRRLGGQKEIAVDVRVVSATHRDLRAAVNDGSFRADLYYRLAVARATIPPLRERPEDVEPLVRHFVDEMTDAPGAFPFGFATLEALRAHRWTGNVRELRNVVEAALAIGRVQVEGREVAPDDGALTRRDDGAPITYRDARAAVLARFERAYLSELIEACEHNASEAARRARVDRPHLLTLLRKHGLR